MFIWFQSLDRLFHVYMVPELGQVISCLYGSRAWTGYFMFLSPESLLVHYIGKMYEKSN